MVMLWVLFGWREIRCCTRALIKLLFNDIYIKLHFIFIEKRTSLFQSMTLATGLQGENNVVRSITIDGAGDQLYQASYNIHPCHVMKLLPIWPQN